MVTCLGTQVPLRAQVTLGTLLWVPFLSRIPICNERLINHRQAAFMHLKLLTMMMIQGQGVQWFPKCLSLGCVIKRFTWDHMFLPEVHVTGLTFARIGSGAALLGNVSFANTRIFWQGGFLYKDNKTIIQHARELRILNNVTQDRYALYLASTFWEWNWGLDFE